MQVVREVDGGIVRCVVLLDDAGDEVPPVNHFLAHLTDSAYSPNTVCAYAYDLRHVTQFLNERSLGWNDLRHVTQFLNERSLGWNDFRPSTALEFLGYLRRVCRPDDRRRDWV